MTPALTICAGGDLRLNASSLDGCVPLGLSKLRNSRQRLIREAQ